ncbi:type II secretion system secretin GspD [Neptunicella sp. SCSIO 80796]|uniref:type II secretion system secretin GspD n=1 Tax=Neptunicella plasticusilytica TaxID=3117012 RepID=UPI003A4E4D24
MRLTSQSLLKGFFTLLISAALAFSTAVAAAEYSPNFKGTDINEFINIVGKNLKKTMIVDPNVRGKITVRSYDLMNEQQYYQFFLNVLQVYGFAIVEMPNGVLKVVRDKTAKTSNLPVVENDLLNGDEMITRVVPVYNVSVRELSPLLRQLNDQAGGGNVVNYDPSNVMIMTGRASVINRLVEIIERVDKAGDQEVEIIKLKYASAAELVRIVENINKEQGAKNTGSPLAPKIVADERTNSVIISGDVKARQRLVHLVQRLDLELETNGNTRVIFLKYAKAEELVTVLQGVSAGIQADEQGGQKTAATRRPNTASTSIEAHNDSNSLVITAQPDMMRNLEDVIRQLDVRRAQVQVEAIIVEVFEGDGTSLGVQWAHKDGAIQQFNNSGVPIGSIAAAAYQSRDVTTTDYIVGTESGTATPITKTTPGDKSLIAEVLGAVNGTLFGIVKDDWAAVVQAVSSDTNSNILATPHLTTMDNEEAYFIVGEEVPIITGQTASTGSNNNPFQTVDRKEVGIKLKVTPQINEGNAVQLLIEQEVSSVSGATAVDISINKREIKTSVIVDDGGTVVLGGLIDEDVQESVSKVPLLGDIPFIGNLFKSSTSSKRKRNLMVFIRPTIIRDGLTMDKISNKKYNYIRAQQLERRANGVNLMPNTNTPVLPEWDAQMALPPNYENYLQDKNNKDNKD